MAKSKRDRADSLIQFRNCRNDPATGTLLRLSRAAVVFEVYNPYSIVQLSEVLSQITLRRGERVVYQGRGVVTNLVSTGLMAIVSASLVDPWSDLSELAPGPALREEVESFVEDWSESQQRLSPNYKQTVIDVRHFLEEFSRWVEQGETLTGVREPGASAALVEDFTQDVARATLPKLDELFAAFEESTRGLDRKTLNTHKAFAQRELHPLLMTAPYIHRTYTKPLGYAGDYEMVNMIVRNAWEGANTYVRVVNRFPLQIATAEAHRQRIEMLQEALRRERSRWDGAIFQVLNVGCGPAAEIQALAADRDFCEGARVELLDFNEETLEFARGEIGRAVRDAGSRLQTEFRHQSIHELLKGLSRRDETVEARYGFVYCAGLFDYLSDPVCCRLVQLFYDMVRPGGAVLVTNVDVDNPARGFMEHVLEWSLVLRDRAKMAEFAPPGSESTVYADATGCNLFLALRKPLSESP